MNARSLIAGWALAGLAPASAVPEPGAITGRVVDVRGRSLPFASVVILRTQWGAMTRECGRFTIRNVPPGTYSLKASFVGHFPDRADSIEVRPGGTSETLFKLRPDPDFVPDSTGGIVLAPPGNSVSSEERLVRELMGRLPGFDGLEPYISPYFAPHSDTESPLRGMDAFRTQFEDVFGRWPALRFKIHDVFSKGDQIVVRWTAHSCPEDSPSLDEVLLEGVSIFAMHHGKILRAWEFFYSGSIPGPAPGAR